MDIARLGQLVADQTITPAQLAWLCSAPADDAKSVATAIDALLPIKKAQPVVFQQTLNALFAAKGFSAAPPTQTSSAAASTTQSSSTTSTSTTSTTSTTSSTSCTVTTAKTTSDTTTTTSTATEVHFATCDLCHMRPIRGPRFKCSVCEDFDLCAGCEAKKAHPAGHLLVKMRTADQKEDGDVAEVIAICIDVSGSMQTPFEADGQADGSNKISRGRTRLEAVKQMFYGFRDQTTTFTQDGATHLLGLISYDSKIRVHTLPTKQMEVFEAVVDDMKCGGSTAIFEAIVAACKMLTPFKAMHPRADLRILCLSDGMNNCTVVPAEAAFTAVQNMEVVVDFLLVGNQPDAQLLKLVQATGGECYQINSLAEGFECLESRGVISLSARRNGAPKPQFKRQAVGFAQVEAAPIRTSQQTQQSQAKQQASQMKVVDLHVATGSSAASSGGAQRRILQELQRFEKNPSDAFRVFPGERPDGSIGFLKVLMVGKRGSPYEGGVFEMLMEFPMDYPFKPPKLTFVTPIYHYAVSSQGAICSEVLRDTWSPALSFFKCLECVYDELMEPERHDPTCSNSLRSWLSELKRVQPQEYANNARQHTAQSAGESLVAACQRITSGSKT